MQLTIDIKDSAVEQIMYLLNHLKSDVKIINKTESSLDIEEILPEDKEYKELQKLKSRRKIHPEEYQAFETINWN